MGKEQFSNIKNKIDEMYNHCSTKEFYKICLTYLSKIENSDNYEDLWFVHYNIMRHFRQNKNTTEAIKHGYTSLDYVKKFLPTTPRNKYYFNSIQVIANCHYMNGNLKNALSMYGNCASYYMEVNDMNNWFCIMVNIVNITKKVDTCKYLLKNCDKFLDKDEFLDKTFYKQQLTILLGECFLYHNLIKDFYKLLHISKDEYILNSLKKLMKDTLVKNS